MPSLCVYCKGPHDYRSCALYLRSLKALAKVSVGSSFSGSVPTPFIGHANYPHVNVGFLSLPQGDASLHDNPSEWSAKEYSIPRIVELRKSLVHVRQASNIRSTGKLMDDVKEVALGSKPSDVSVTLKDRPQGIFAIDHAASPWGPSGTIVSSEVLSYARIHTKVQNVHDDADRKASDAITYLYKNGFDENALNKVLMVGGVGLKMNRHLVPTRWSITATDDMLGKHVLESIRDKPTMEGSVFEAEYLGNYYVFVCFPRVFSFELFELYLPAWKTGREQYSTDFEPFAGRKDYAHECAGGYYTVRLAAAEYLASQKRQASVLAIRVITEEYTTPLGVWVTREASRRAFRSTPIRISGDDLLKEFVRVRLRTKFGLAVDNLLRKSKLGATLHQARLSSWMGL